MAVVDEPPRPAFYEGPATLPTTNGAVIRSERLSFLLDPLDATSLVRNATRVLYRTTDRGTAGVHTYMDRVSQGLATLDVVRAAQRLAGTGLSSSSPVGLQGYSQGGGAAAAAAANLDGGPFSAFAFFALRGLAASYDIDLAPYLDATGRATMDAVEQDCVFDLLDNAFVRSETLSADGRPMSELMTREPFRTVIAQQRIGTIRPSVPVLVSHSTLDDTIPYAVGTAMARSWCGQGANVRFSANDAPLHVGGIVPHAAEAQLFWEARFAGLPQVSNCWLL